MAEVGNNAHVPSYQDFRSKVEKAQKLDGNIIIKNGEVTKVDFGNWHKCFFFGDHEDANRKALPEESAAAREALFKAIKAHVDVLNTMRSSKNPGAAAIDLREVADELGVKLDANMDVIEGDTIQVELSRLEMSKLFDELEGGSSVKEGYGEDRTLNIGGAFVSKDQVETMLDRVETILQKEKGQSETKAKSLVASYKAELNAPNPDFTTGKLKALFTYDKGDLFGKNRQLVNLSLRSVAERLLAGNPNSQDGWEKAFNLAMDPYSASSAEGAVRGLDLLSHEQIVLLDNYKTAGEAQQNVIQLNHPKGNVQNPNDADEAQEKVDPNRAFFADLVLNEDIYKAVEDRIGNATERLKNVVGQHIETFKNLCNLVRTKNEDVERIFAPLKNVVGEAFTDSFKDILYRLASGSTDDADLLNKFHELAKRERLEDKIDVGLSRNLFDAGLPSAHNLDVERLCARLGIDFSDDVPNSHPQENERPEVKTLRVVAYISGVYGNDDEEGFTNAVRELQNTDGGKEKLDAIAKFLFAQTVAENCNLSAESRGANERMLFDRILDSLSHMDQNKTRKMFAAWLRGSSAQQASPGAELLKGADPTIIKLLQGCKPPQPEAGKKLSEAQQQLSKTLRDITNRMPEMSDPALKASMYKVYQDIQAQFDEYNNGHTDKPQKKLDHITVDEVLGSASVAQALKCTLHIKTGEQLSTKSVVIKLIKDDAKQAFIQEKNRIAGENLGDNPGVGAVATVGFVRSVTEEFDLQREQINMLLGMATYGESAGETFTVDFAPTDDTKFTFEAQKHVSSVKPLLKEGVKADDVIEKIRNARTEIENDVNLTTPEAKQTAFEQKLREIAKDNCVLSSANCIIMEDAGDKPMDRVLNDLINDIKKNEPEKDVEKKLQTDKNLREDLLKMKASLLEVAADLSTGLFTDKLHMFHGDFNGGNLMYNVKSGNIKIIDYGKGMSLTADEAEAIKGMFTRLTGSFQNGNAAAILDDYKKVIAAEIKRVNSQLKEGNAADVLQSNELNCLNKTLRILDRNSADRTQEDEKQYQKLLSEIEKDILKPRDRNLLTLGKVFTGRSDLSNVGEIMEKFRTGMQNNGMATPLPLFDFFGSMGKIGKNLAMVDAELAVLNTRIEKSSKDVRENTDFDSSLKNLTDKRMPQEIEITVPMPEMKFDTFELNGKVTSSLFSGAVSIDVDPVKGDEATKASLSSTVNQLKGDLKKKDNGEQLFELHAKELGSVSLMETKDYKSEIKKRVQVNLGPSRHESIFKSNNSVSATNWRIATMLYLTAKRAYDKHHKLYTLIPDFQG